MPHPTTYPSEFKSPHNANAIEQLDFSDCLENYSRAGFNQKAFEFEFEAHTNRTDTHSKSHVRSKPFLKLIDLKSLAAKAKKSPT